MVYLTGGNMNWKFLESLKRLVSFSLVNYFIPNEDFNNFILLDRLEYLDVHHLGRHVQQLSLNKKLNIVKQFNSAELKFKIDKQLH